MDFLSRVKNYIHQNQLFRNGARIVVGVSGGADSAVLLHLLCALRAEKGWVLYAAHFNHGLNRGDEEAQKQVEQMCVQWNVPLTVERWTIARGRAKKIISLEERARDARMRFFIKICRKNRAEVIALAHHQDDAAETVLMKLLRGSGMKGLRGILPRREIDGGIVVRPLLGVTKHEILIYAKRHRITFVEDRTNHDLDFFRNRIRHELLPLLERRYNAGVRSNLLNFADIASAEYDFMEQNAQSVFSKIVLRCSSKEVVFCLKKLKKVHLALRRFLFRHAFEWLHGNMDALTFEHNCLIDQMMKNGPCGAILNLPKRTKAVKTADHLIIRAD